MKPSKNSLLIASLLAAILGAEVVKAEVLPAAAIAFDTYSQGSNPQVGYTIGWDFTTTRPIYVTALGYYDYAADGFGASHDVGIFNLSGSLLVSATVAAGTAETNVVGTTPYGAFRYHDLSANYLLLPGTYRIGGVGADNDPAQNSPVNLTTAAGITLGDSYYAFGAGSLTYPNLFASGPSEPFSGPNLLFIPEPSVVALLGLTGMMLVRRRVTRNG